MVTPPTDDELMARASADDQRAFAELYERHRRVVFTFLLHVTGARQVAEDLLQETFLRVWRGRAGYRASGEFRAWLFTIARRLAVDRFRRQGLVWEDDPAALETAVSVDAPDRRAEARDELARLQRALDQLPPAQREVVLLARLVGAGAEEIAWVTGSTPGAVRVQLHRALRRLRALLDG
ncbi:MAG: RNA polymerase sigma factor [Candidatus Rokuibacteriota bacterium]